MKCSKTGFSLNSARGILRTMLLIEAIKKERISQICYFLKVDIDVNLQDANGQTALIYCCFVKNSEKRSYILKLLLSTNEVDVNCRDKYGRSALSWMCLLGLTDSFEVIVDEYFGKIDLRTVDNYGNTLLMLAVLSKNLKMVQLLLKTLSNCGLLYQVNSPNKKGLSPMLVAFRRQDKKCADLLLSQGCAIVSSILHNLRSQLSPEEKTIPLLPARGQAQHTKLRSLQRQDDDYNLKMPTEEELLQFLYGTNTKSETTDFDGGITEKPIPNFNDLRPARVQGFFSANTSTAKRKTSKVHRPRNSHLNTQNTFENLYSIYSTQLSCSFRRSTIITPSPPPCEEMILTPPRRRSLHHRSSNLSQSSSRTSPSKRSSTASSAALLPVPESAEDERLRIKHSRNTRAASVQIAKHVPRFTMSKRSRSSTFSQPIKVVQE